MLILITGADGFIGKNLLMFFQEIKWVKCITFTRKNSVEELPELVKKADWVFHLAGINRPLTTNEFTNGNVELTKIICNAIKNAKKLIPIVLSSSTQVGLDNEYAISKKAAEELLLALHYETGNPIFIYRLPNVFGKLARPSYNSVVATFCYNITRDMPIKINNPSETISLAYIDDILESFNSLIVNETNLQDCFIKISPLYSITVGELAEQLYRFKTSRQNLITEPVGTGLTRALYSTYVSYLPSESFAYSIKQYSDERGVFVEMLKTKDSGQFSFFTAYPGVTRGGHYHHSKTEKFLVVRGKAKFCFKHIITGELNELITSGDKPQVVETVPGWTHDITNISDEDLICILWANEIFDQEKPDTYMHLL